MNAAVTGGGNRGPGMERITSTSNPKIRHLSELRAKPKARRETGTFLVEGERLVLDTPPEFLEEIYVTSEVYERLKAQLSERTDKENVVLLSAEAMAKASDTKSPQGIMALVRQPVWRREDLLADPALLLVLENIQDPGNLGTMLRTAEAAGAGGVILSAGCADLFSPKAVRATMSAVFRVPFVTEQNIPAAVLSLQKKGVRVYAACLHGYSSSYETRDYRSPCAFVIGNEAKGLCEDTIRAADERVFIPMAGEIESLNAAVSAGILMYEAARQRGFR